MERYRVSSRILTLFLNKYFILTINRLIGVFFILVDPTVAIIIRVTHGRELNDDLGYSRANILASDYFLYPRDDCN